MQLFDFKQMMNSPTRVTKNTSSIIDLLYCSNPENISDSFVSHYSISDHFPICFTRTINTKLKNAIHFIAPYRCFKTFNEEVFLSDLTSEFNSSFSFSHSNIDDDIAILTMISSRDVLYNQCKRIHVKSFLFYPPHD